MQSVLLHAEPACRRQSTNTRIGSDWSSHADTKHISTIVRSGIGGVGVGDSGQLGALSLAVLSGYVFRVSAPREDAGVRGVQVEFNGEAADLWNSWSKMIVPIPRSFLAVDPGARRNVPSGRLAPYDKLDLPLSSGALARMDQKKACFRFRRCERKAIGCEGSTCFRTTPWLSNREAERRLYSRLQPWRDPRCLVCRTQQLDSTGNQGGEAPRYIYVDRLEPTQFVGLLVHYLIEVRNRDCTVASGQLQHPAVAFWIHRPCLSMPGMSEGWLKRPELSQALP